jgi:hypothetical protein
LAAGSNRETLALAKLADSLIEISASGEEKLLMVCRSCQAENVTEFGAEIRIHFPAHQGLDEPIPEARGLFRLRLHKFYASRN